MPALEMKDLLDLEMAIMVRQIRIGSIVPMHALLHLRSLPAEGCHIMSNCLMALACQVLHP